MAMKFRSARGLDLALKKTFRAIRAEVRRELQRGALRIEATAAESIIEQTPGGRIYPSKGRKGAMHAASPAGSPPNADTGRLHTSITTATVADTAERIAVETGTNVPYGAWLEFGTSKMAPRPFMGPAFDQHVAGTRDRVRAAVTRGARKSK